MDRVGVDRGAIRMCVIQMKAKSRPIYIFALHGTDVRKCYEKEEENDIFSNVYKQQNESISLAYHIIKYHTIPYHTMLYHTIPEVALKQ